MEKKETEGQPNKNEQFALNLVDRILKLERAYGGPSEYWFRQGVITAASVSVFVAVPHYRLITGTFALLSVADSLLGLSMLKWAEDRLRKQQEDFLKKYPTPQSFFQDFLKEANKDKKDLH